MIGGAELNRYLAGVVSGDGPPNLFAAGLGGGEASENGIRNLAERVDPERGVYIAASQIARVDLVPEGPATL